MSHTVEEEAFNKAMAEKKKRGQNFTMEEKDRLIKLLAQYRSTILNKKTDGTTNMAKMQAWNALTNKFNSCGSTYRTKDSLVKQWDKLKTEAKIYKGKNNKGVMGTGGGPSTVKSDPVLDQACDLLGRACSGMLAVNDSDADIPTSGELESSMFHDIATEVEIYEREGEQDVPMVSCFIYD
ncbi:nuclear apoptosis-inducing factor 1-like [Plutella xylostella]|uniref:nuclear apoptosis-inducing factor 1-like n=1 Tax=Plutella xylostella TaxID=51655 RepID=UPI002032F199|nr:nuclear apoptosis-inducing factor 1-like [Plutella xylostella]